MDMHLINDLTICTLLYTLIVNEGIKIWIVGDKMEGLDKELVQYFNRHQNNHGQYPKHVEVEMIIEDLTCQYRRYRKMQLNKVQEKNTMDIHAQLINQFVSKYNKTTPEMAFVYLMVGTAYKDKDKPKLIARYIKQCYPTDQEEIYNTYCDLIEDMVEHRSKLQNLEYRWLTKHKNQVVDNTPPRGRSVYIDNNYRVYENGVVQTLKGKHNQEIFMNMVGTNETDKFGRSQIHLSNVQDKHEHVFVSKEELVAACFLPDPDNPEDTIAYKDPSKPLSPKNLIFVNGEDKTSQRNRLTIFKSTGCEIPKHRDIKHTSLTRGYSERVTRKATDDMLRKLKNQYKTTAKDYVVALINQRVTLTTKYSLTNNKHIKESKPLVILDMLEFWVEDTQRIKINQQQFYSKINQRLEDVANQVK